MINKLLFFIALITFILLNILVNPLKAFWIANPSYNQEKTNLAIGLAIEDGYFKVHERTDRGFQIYGTGEPDAEGAKIEQDIRFNYQRLYLQGYNNLENAIPYLGKYSLGIFRFVLGTKLSKLGFLRDVCGTLFPTYTYEKEKK